MKVIQCFSFVVRLPKRLEPLEKCSCNNAFHTSTSIHLNQSKTLYRKHIVVRQFWSIPFHQPWTQHIIVRGSWKIKQAKSWSKHRAALFNGKMKAFPTWRNCIPAIWPFHILKAVVSSIVFCEALPTKLLYFSSFCLRQQIHLWLGTDQKHIHSAIDRASASHMIFNLVAASSCTNTQLWCKILQALQTHRQLLIAAEMHICIWKQVAQ